MNKTIKRIVSTLLMSAILIGTISAQNIKFVPSYNVEKLEYHKSKYFDEYAKLTSDNSKTVDDYLTLLEEWEANDKDADLSKCYFLLMLTLATNTQSIPDVEINEYEPFAIVKNPVDENDDLYVYRDHVLSSQLLTQGIAYLSQALVESTNRIDLWDNIISAYEFKYLWPFEADVLVEFLDFADYMKEVKGKWYVEFNQPLNLTSWNNNFDDFLYNYVQTKADTMMGEYGHLGSAQKVLLRLEKTFPTKTRLQNQLGLTYLYTDPAIALTYFEKAYKLDNNNINAAVNAAVASELTSNKKAFKKYEKIVKKSNNKDAIFNLESNLKAIREKK